MRHRMDVRLRMCSIALGAAFIVLAVAAPAFAQIDHGTRYPMIKEAAYTNAVASELKSLQWTHFYGTFDRPVWAVLTIHDGKGREVARIFDGAVPDANKRFWFPSWNGKDKDGKYLPSSVAYEWRLKVNFGPHFDIASGRIAVCRVLFTVGGDTRGEPAVYLHQHRDKYMVEGRALAYVQVIGSDDTFSGDLYLSDGNYYGWSKVPLPLNDTCRFSIPKRGTNTVYFAMQYSGVRYRITFMQ